MLTIDQIAPLDIKVLDESGNETSLGDFLGKYLVLYFYPKDQTPGCTKEACEFRDMNTEIEKLGAKVIGISADDQKSHQKFRDKHQLNFTLLSDPDHQLLEAFGVWGQKSLFGKLYMGILRTTFLLDSEGKIIHIWEKVNPVGHAKEVYERLKLIKN